MELFTGMIHSQWGSLLDPYADELLCGRSAALRTAVYLGSGGNSFTDEWVTVTGTYHYDEEKEWRFRS